MSGEPSETLLSALEEADEELRRIYRELADNPTLAPARHDALDALHAKRRELATEVGLAALAQRRARARMSEPLPPTAQPSPEPPPPSPPSPVSTDVLERWSHDARANGVGTVAFEDRATPTWESTLAELMVRVGAPRSLDLELDDEIDALDAVGSAPLIERWAKLPMHMQVVWVEMLVARTRAVKSVEGLSSAQRARLKTIISRYPFWAAEHRPGYMHGLKAEHEPRHGSWATNAEVLWDTLGSYDTPLRGAAATPKSKKKLAKRSEEGAPDSARTIDASWALWPRVRGRAMVLVGGEPREPNRQRIERAFELGSLEWIDVSGPRRLDAVVERVRRRSFDVLVLLKGLIDHKQSEPLIAAAKESEVPWALAESYGPASIKAALDRFLG